MTDHTTFESDGGPSGRPALTPRQAALTAGKYHLLGATACVALWVVFEWPSLHFAFVRLGWWLAPWRDFPIPYDRADFSWVHGPLGVVAGTQVATIITFSGLLFLVHGAAFRVTVLLHRWFGWPRYWPDVRDSVSLRTAWAESARRSWWFWVAGSLIWELLTELATGLRYVYPIIADGQPFLIANIVSIGSGYCYTSALALRERVAMQIGRDELRCVKCDYRLRGLQSRLCPECGHAFDPNERPEFRLKWERFDGRGRFRRLVRILLPIALLAAPLWVPLVILGAPRPWLQWIPSSLQPGSLVICHDPRAFPIRPDAVCRISHGETLYILRFRSRRSPYGPTCVAGRWPNTESFERHPPESRVMSEFDFIGDPFPWEGPWKFRWQWRGGNIIWLYRPDATYEVESMLVEDFDGDLSWAEEDPAGQP